MRLRTCLLAAGQLAAAMCLHLPCAVCADGELVPPRDYKGSLEENAQEAILIFHSAQTPGEATEDLILKVRVTGEADNFAWVIPFPTQPAIFKEEDGLFQELFAYVETRRQQVGQKPLGDTKGAEAPKAEAKGIEVLARKVVGNYDTAIVRETQAGSLNLWLLKEGYQALANADDVIAFYRRKGYVFACIKVSGAALVKGQPVDLHPLRFSFTTGGRDGIYYPMKMSGLQGTPFDVNLYVFYRSWLNDRINKFGYVHRGLRLRYRDWDSAACKPNAGKTWSAPDQDPFLKDMAPRLPTVARLFQRLHPGERYYLTNLQATGLAPPEVRQWADDLWLFPYYVDPSVVPSDVRDGPAWAAWPAEGGPAADSATRGGGWLSKTQALLVALVAAAAVGGVVALLIVRRRQSAFLEEPR